jgi:hypothetical protein
VGLPSGFIRHSEPAQPTDLAHPTFGEPVRSDGRWHAFLGGEREDPQRGVEELGRRRSCARLGLTLDLVGDSDEAA